MRRTFVLGVLLALGSCALIVGCGSLVGIKDLVVDADSEPIVPTADTEPPPADVAAEGTLDASTDVLDSADADAGSKLVFVTSDEGNAAMGGRAGADVRCAAAAARGGLEGGFVAWVSTSTTNAIDRIAHLGAYRLLDGTIVASNKQQLASGNLEAAIDVTEQNEMTTGTNLVWTGTSADGQGGSVDCKDWTSSGNLDLGVAGSLDQPKDGHWTNNGGGFGLPAFQCQSSARLYCFQR